MRKKAADRWKGSWSFPVEALGKRDRKLNKTVNRFVAIAQRVFSGQFAYIQIYLYNGVMYTMGTTIISQLASTFFLPDIF